LKTTADILNLHGS